MTTCDPPLALFRRQIESIRAQTHPDWVCVISDDCSQPERFAAIQEVLGDDPRFLLSRGSHRLGFYRNFERALALAPAGASHVALADQDDRWHPDKLATLLAELGDAQLVYSDARVVDGDGRVLADSYWGRRSNNHSDLLSLLVANSVTGAASLFPASLLRDALPFPPAQFAHFHDHWLALVALSLGDIAFVERPCTTTSSTATRRSATPPRTACRGCASGWRRCAATRASGSGCGGCTTTSTSAGCCSSRRSCGCGCGRGWRRASGARSSASSAPTARSPRWRG